MKIHSDYMTVQTEKKREFIDITENVRSAAEKSGIHNGIILICALHSNSGLFINEGDPAFHQDVDAWLEKLAPVSGAYQYGQRAESTGGAHLQGILLNAQTIVSLARRQAGTRAVATHNLRRTRRPAPETHSDQGAGRIAAERPSPRSGRNFRRCDAYYHSNGAAQPWSFRQAGEKLQPLSPQRLSLR